MIKQLEGLFEPWDVYSARVLAAYRSYYDMPECQFWMQDNTSLISLVDGFAILAIHNNPDWEELAAFLRMQPWSRLQCSAEISANLPFPVEWRSMLVRFAAPLNPEPSRLPPASDPGKVYDILVRCGLGAKNRNDWMADLALRWRRGTARTWMLDEASTGSAMAITTGHVYIGALGTLPEHRGQGLAGQLISHICGQYAGRDVCLTCREELQGFYESLGFVRAGDMVTLRKEDDA